MAARDPSFSHSGLFFLVPERSLLDSSSPPFAGTCVSDGRNPRGDDEHATGDNDKNSREVQRDDG